MTLIMKIMKKIKKVNYIRTFCQLISLKLPHQINRPHIVIISIMYVGEN